MELVVVDYTFLPLFIKNFYEYVRAALKDIRVNLIFVTDQRKPALKEKNKRTIYAIFLSFYLSPIFSPRRHKTFQAGIFHLRRNASTICTAYRSKQLWRGECSSRCSPRERGRHLKEERRAKQQLNRAGDVFTRNV